ncbi:hypothetical protein [Leuconostoc rapi]|uniref:hypothetical protein n=1 Tax=Leuconostoc rapi TaxID=1406906 RepID=UPI00195E3EF9|nr:hypothetical protein [Leuconostoc rapi]MBM7435556.1 ABC-type transport system involved in Fe-S cluster assembly fused permease/ATPase subunit [Leuconostoc rapi]
MKKMVQFIGALVTTLIGLFIFIPILLTIIGVAVPLIFSIIAILCLVILVCLAVGGIITLVTIWRLKRHIKKGNGSEFVHQGKHYNIYMSHAGEQQHRRDVTDDDQ